MRLVALVVVAGCGRLDFEAVHANEPTITCDWGPFGAPVALDAAVQSPWDDWGASPSADGLELVFYAYRSDAVGDADIYDSVRVTIGDPWPAPTPVVSVETTHRDAEPSITADRLELVFARTDASDVSQIFIAKRAAIDLPFGAPTLAPGIVGTAASEDQPCITPDGLRLVYRSDPGSGATSLVEATRPDRASPFVVIGPVIPRNGKDVDPGFSSDGLELFFASNGRGGAGGIDIFTASRPAVDQPFGAVTQVSELDTSMDETDPRLSADGTQLYLDWNTLSAGGENADLFVATRSCL